MLKIKATDKEYFAACEDGCVYGCVRGNSNILVYAELGSEIKYNPPEGVKPEKGRQFIDCSCFFALSKDDLKDGIFEKQFYSGKVIIYY